MDDKLPFLDLEFSWDDNDDLFWGVHLKPETTLKYLNTDSLHTRSCKYNIGPGVIRRLADLTKRSEDLEYVKVSDYYPKHYQALVTARLNTHKVVPKGRLERMSPADAFILKQGSDPDPCFKQCWAKIESCQKSTRRSDKRSIHFVNAYSGGFLKTSVFAILKRLKRKYKLKWFRFRVVYSRFPNLEELIQADLRRKLNEGITSDHYGDRACNCSKPNRDMTTGLCVYGGDCRKKCLIYKADCLMCSESYIGSTMDTLKGRMDGHCGDVREFVRTGKRADSFENHFSAHVRRGDLARLLVKNKIEKSITRFNRYNAPSRAQIRQMYRVGIIWKADNGTVIARNFKTDRCRLCCEERWQIYVGNLAEIGGGGDRGIMNENNDYYATCLHRPHVPALTRCDTENWGSYII